jgi:pimeloyl-ACP methyl ester carboxylesterase
MKKLVITATFLYLSILLTLYFTQSSMMYHPAKTNHELSTYNLAYTEEIFIITKDNVKLQAWYRKPPKDKLAVFLHGNGGNLENRVKHLKELIDLDYGFIIPAWRGFGKSEGKPTKEGLYLDAEAAIDFLKTQGYSTENTLIIGESLGTGIATEMALKYKFKDLFLITPYTSIAGRASELCPFFFAEYLTKDNFEVLSKINKIKIPLFIIHGTADKVVPYQHSEEIFAKANDPKELILYPGIGHVNYNIKNAFEQMDKFFEKH